MSIARIVGGALLGLSVGLISYASYTSFLSFDHLSGDQEESRRRVHHLGPFAGRSHFTETGWRYRTRSIQAATLAIVTMILGGLFLGNA